MPDLPTLATNKLESRIIFISCTRRGISVKELEQSITPHKIQIPSGNRDLFYKILYICSKEINRYKTYFLVQTKKSVF